MSVPQLPEWGDKCPNCDGTFPFLYGSHPTWIPCALRRSPDPLVRS